MNKFNDERTAKNHTKLSMNPTRRLDIGREKDKKQESKSILKVMMFMIHVLNVTGEDRDRV